MAVIKGIYNPEAPDAYYWHLQPSENDPYGCKLSLVDDCGHIVLDVLSIEFGQLERFSFTPTEAALIGLTVNSDGFIATTAEREKEGTEKL